MRKSEVIIRWHAGWHAQVAQAVEVLSEQDQQSELAVVMPWQDYEDACKLLDRLLFDVDPYAARIVAAEDLLRLRQLLG